MRFIYTIIFLTIFFCTSFSQTIKFTKGTYHPVRKASYIEYNVNGKTYHAQHYKSFRGVYIGFDYTIQGGYLIGYDSLTPEKGEIYLNKPFFDSPNDTNKIKNSVGTIIYMNKRYCDYQFIVGKTNNEPVTARQSISKEDVKEYDIKVGSKFKVQYVNGIPEVAIICYEKPITEDAPTNFNKPFLSKPNGFAFDFETKFVYLNPSPINNYLKKNFQPTINNFAPFYIFNVSQYYKIGLWWECGLGGGHYVTGNIGLGYLQKLSRRFYLNFSTHLTGFDYTMNAFKNNELKTIADTSQLIYSNFSINPRIDLMVRKVSNNVWGCQFLKIGVGVLIDFSDNSWYYEVGHDAIGSKGNHYINYTSAQKLNSMPPFSKYLFYISLSYSFCNFLKQ